MICCRSNLLAKLITLFFRKRYDVFISYAFEDKEQVAAPLKKRLKELGIHVFYAGDILKTGTRLMKEIGTGLRQSAYAVLILSPNYTGPWALGEMFFFIQREELEKKEVILPVWHGLTYEQVRQDFHWIADHYAYPTSAGIEIIALSIAEKIKEWKKQAAAERRRKIGFRISAVIALVAISLLFYSIRQENKKTEQNAGLPAKELFDSIIRNRVMAFQRALENDIRKKIENENGKQSLLGAVADSYRRLIRYGKSNQGELHLYSFKNDLESVNGRQNIENLGITIDETPYSNYGIEEPLIYTIRSGGSKNGDTVFFADYVILNQRPVTFRIDSLLRSEKNVIVYVTYTQNIRAVQLNFTCKAKAARNKIQHIRFSGFKPSEEYIFEKTRYGWHIIEIH